MKDKELYVYGFEVVKLSPEMENTYTFKIETDTPSKLEFKKGEMWKALEKCFVEDFNCKIESIKDDCIFTAFTSEYSTMYDHALLEELREEYFGDIVIRNDYDRITKVIINQK
tara:strand:+ start:5561 stop:5899 length:339 start_codon:yes stop_codon:yes gene_type:complete